MIEALGRASSAATGTEDDAGSDRPRPEAVPWLQLTSTVIGACSNR